MKAYRLKVKNIIIITSIATLLVIIAIMFIFHWAEAEKLWELIWHYGLVIIVPTLLWESIENYFWQVSWFRKLFRSFLNIPPDIRGRWEGTINSDKNEINFVIEIDQTLTKTHIDAYLNRDISHSYFATITTNDEMEKSFTLCYLYHVVREADPDYGRPAGKYYGFSVLELNENDEAKELSGNYFTDRIPIQSKGEINLNWIGLARRGKF